MRALRNALNPVSTAVTRWWCHSGLRAILRGKPRHVRRRGPDRMQLTDPRVRQARIEAIERVLGRDRD